MTEPDRQILMLLRSDGPAAALEALLRHKPRDLVERCSAVVEHLVRAEKDAVSAILLGWTGAVHVQRLAGDAPTVHGLDRELLGHARSLFFTLGSLLWPGWGDPDLVLDDTARSIGRVGAERSLVLAQLVDAHPMARCRAHWLVGVHALFGGDLERSRQEIVAAARLSEEVGAVQETRFLRAYLLMAQAASQPADREIPYEFERACATFERSSDTAAFASQLRIAWSVWAPERPLPEPTLRTQDPPRFER